MTVCFGPSIKSTIFTLIIAVLVPSLIIYFFYKKRKPKNRLFFVFFSVTIFIILFLGIFAILFHVFTPSCGGEISCIPFEFYSKNSTCKYGREIIYEVSKCNQLREKYLSQLKNGEEACLTFGENFIIETG